MTREDILNELSTLVHLYHQLAQTAFGIGEEEAHAEKCAATMLKLETAICNQVEALERT